MPLRCRACRHRRVGLGTAGVWIAPGGVTIVELMTNFLATTLEGTIACAPERGHRRRNTQVRPPATGSELCSDFIELPSQLGALFVCGAFVDDESPRQDVGLEPLRVIESAKCIQIAFLRMPSLFRIPARIN